MTDSVRMTAPCPKCGVPVTWHGVLARLGRTDWAISSHGCVAAPVVSAAAGSPVVSGRDR